MAHGLSTAPQMFANSKNVNISRSEFHITYGAKNSETTQKGKHIFD